ncbi:hypothetical protein LTS08_000922 [Lithohypha guttulata]|nr:hypothetical protein LTS08_000922 [Lithohypha guttulata]
MPPSQPEPQPKNDLADNHLDPVLDSSDIADTIAQNQSVAPNPQESIPAPKPLKKTRKKGNPMPHTASSEQDPQPPPAPQLSGRRSRSEQIPGPDRKERQPMQRQNTTPAPLVRYNTVANARATVRENYFDGSAGANLDGETRQFELRMQWLEGQVGRQEERHVGEV